MNNLYIIRLTIIRNGNKMKKNNERELFLVNYLPDHLRCEYEFWTENNPDIPEIAHPLINLSDVFKAYFVLVHYFTDSSSEEESENMLVGIRSVDLLASALGRQITSFGGRTKYTNDLDICATLFFGMVKNHAFSDGNKRTALLVLLYQLQLFGYIPAAPESSFEKLVLAVAESSVASRYHSTYKKFKKVENAEICTISYLLKRMVSKKNHSYHISPTTKEFCSALESLGVQCNLENGKMHFLYTAPGRWKLFKTQPKQFTIPFGGDTRVIGPKTARDVLQGLELYDQFASYQDILDGKEPLYELTDNFKEPLRRLKDK